MREAKGRNHYLKMQAKHGVLEEDNLLIEQFDKGMQVKELSKDNKRTEGAINSRLLKLGRISLTDVTKYGM